MIRDKLLSFSATAQESYVKEIHFHVDFKSIKIILRARQRKYKHIEGWGLSEQQGRGTGPCFFSYTQRTPEEKRRLFWPQKHKYDQPLEQSSNSVQYRVG